MALARGVDELFRGIDGRHVRRADAVNEFRRQRAWPTADVEYALARTQARKIRHLGGQLHRVPAHEPVVGVSGNEEAHRSTLIAPELLEPLVADSEMVRDLVQHDAPDLPAQTLAIGTVESLERPAIDGDLVREYSGVAAPASCQRDALVEAEQRLTGRWLFLDNDCDIRDRLAKFGREGGQRVLDLPLEIDLVGP
jgi:hypothetical protein